MTWEDRRRPAVRGQQTGFQTAVQAPRPEGASHTSLGLLGVHPASGLTWSGVSVLVGSSFRTGGPGLLPTDNSGTCQTSPRTSQGTGGSATRAGLSSQLSPAPGPAARPFLHLHVPQSFPAQPPSEAWAGLGDHSCPVNKRQAEDRAGGCPGRACRILLGSSPAFPLAILSPREQVWSKKGITFWMEGLIVNLQRNAVWELGFGSTQRF